MRRDGFTFVEVLILLVVITIGLVGAIGLITYGTRLSSKAQGELIGMATAVSVAMDPQPRLPADTAANWTYTPYAFDAGGIATSTATGFINGLYVQRTETSKDPQDIIARSPGGQVYARSALVEVTVYETIGGAEVASFTTRIVRQRETP